MTGNWNLIWRVWQFCRRFLVVFFFAALFCVVAGSFFFVSFHHSFTGMEFVYLGVAVGNSFKNLIAIKCSCKLVLVLMRCFRLYQSQSNTEYMDNWQSMAWIISFICQRKSIGAKSSSRQVNWLDLFFFYVKVNLTWVTLLLWMKHVDNFISEQTMQQQSNFRLWIVSIRLKYNNWPLVFYPYGWLIECLNKSWMCTNWGIDGKSTFQRIRYKNVWGIILIY